MAIRVSARAVIIQNDAILLSEFNDESGHHFNLPGGGIEPGESARDACRREVREETCLEVGVGELLFTIEYEPIRNRRWAGDGHAISLVFAATPLPGSKVGTSAVLDPNQLGARWVSLRELPECELLPHVTEQIIEYRRTGSFPARFLEEPVNPERAGRYLKD